jgi:hypothetical protein
MSLSFHDTYALVQKSIASIMTPSNQTNNENAIEKSRKLVLRCYNTLASQQELSGVQVASYLMNWNDHYTTHKFQGLYLIQSERYLHTQLNEKRCRQRLHFSARSEYFIFEFRVILKRNLFFLEDVVQRIFFSLFLFLYNELKMYIHIFLFYLYRYDR